MANNNAYYPTPNASMYGGVMPQQPQDQVPMFYFYNPSQMPVFAAPPPSAPLPPPPPPQYAPAPPPPQDSYYSDSRRDSRRDSYPAAPQPEVQVVVQKQMPVRQDDDFSGAIIVFVLGCLVCPCMFLPGICYLCSPGKKSKVVGLLSLLFSLLSAVLIIVGFILYEAGWAFLVMPS